MALGIGHGARQGRRASLPPILSYSSYTEVPCTSKDDLFIALNAAKLASGAGAWSWSDELCARCKSISIDDMLVDDATNARDWQNLNKHGYRLCDSFDQLIDTALRGCRLCSLIIREIKKNGTCWDLFLDWEGWDARRMQRPLHLRIPFWEIDLHTFELTYYETSSKRYLNAGFLEIEASERTNSSQDAPFQYVGRSYPGNPKDPAVTDFITRNLRTCLHHHSICASVQSRESELPTRVIDVGHEGKDPYLFISDKRNGRWATLTYCWGGVRDFLLTSTSIEELRTAIPLPKLPATFKDAILITRSLGIQYLWIDALCIVQDDMENDWPYEAGRMQDYYRNCEVTISASIADNSRQGILTPRTFRLRPLQIKLSSEKLNWKDTVIIRPSHPQHLSDFMRTEDSELHQRGWTCQEYYLPPRTIHFSRRCIVWDCLETSVMEWSYGGKDPGNFGKLFLPIRDQAGTVLQTIRINLERESHPDLDPPPLNNPMKPYKQLQIYDKLPAISGLAGLIHDMLDEEDEYLAGLWRSQLLTDLSWFIEEPAKLAVSDYRAPSWSWAALDGKISLYMNRHGYVDRQTVIHEANVVKSNPSQPFGSVVDGYLRISAPWMPLFMDNYPFKGGNTCFISLPTISHDLPVNLWGSHRLSHVYIGEGGGSKGNVLETERDIRTWIFSGNLQTSRPHWRRLETIVALRYPNASDNGEPYVYLMMDTIPPEHSFLDGSGRFYFGLLMLATNYYLVLQPNPDKEGTFRRIGIALPNWWFYSWQSRTSFDNAPLCEVIIT